MGGAPVGRTAVREGWGERMQPRRPEDSDFITYARPPASLLHRGSDLLAASGPAQRPYTMLKRTDG